MGNTEKGGFTKIAEEFYQFHPQEMLVKERKKPATPISLGMPKESVPDERRVVLGPRAVQSLVNNGCEVLVERGAGEYAKYTDKDYSEAGAKIVYSAQEAFQTDIVLKVAPPSFREIEMMKTHKTVISALNLNTVSAEYLQALNQRALTGLAFEFIEDKVGGLPIVRAMSEIAGSTVMLVAAEYLSSMHGGKGVILGGITGVPPTRVVIIGAGTVAEFAARAAIGLGAEVKIFDNHIYKLRRLKERLGQMHIYTSTLDNGQLADALSRADVVIGALRSENGRAPMVVTEEMVGSMQANSVIIDVSIDQGGCFETSEATTHFSPVFRKYDVTHYCVPNIASRVARTATNALSNIFAPILLEIVELGGVDKMMLDNPWFTKGVYSYRGGLTNRSMADRFNMPCKNLNLILAASI